jgi:mRNA interferase HigB
MKPLREFWERPGRRDAEQPLRAWFKELERTTFRSLADVKQRFRSADNVGDCIVFNVKGNHYRLIARFNYTRQFAYVKKVMDHEEYDKDTWKKECGCFEPPPQHPKASRPGKKTATRRKSS